MAMFKLKKMTLIYFVIHYFIMAQQSMQSYGGTLEFEI